MILQSKLNYRTNYDKQLEAKDFIHSIESSKWFKVSDLPTYIAKEVINLIDYGRYRWYRLEFNEEFDKFCKVPLNTKKIIYDYRERNL